MCHISRDIEPFVRSDVTGIRKRHIWRPIVKLMSTIALAGLTACGGGGSGGSTSSTPSGSVSNPSPPPVVVAPTQTEASRFLTQVSFGATDADIASITGSSYASWLDAQIALPVSASHLTWMDARLPVLRAANASANLSANQFYESFWMQAAGGNDQLRQRVKLALSEIFVVSFNSTSENPRGMASYYDMLGRDAFGNFRTLLEDVTYHPAMGLYLTYVANQKEDAKTGRNPDENYAREVMQLMTIGLWQLNLDGTQKTDLFGNPTPTYTGDDVKGLAKVFTGLSYYNPTPSSATFYGYTRDAEMYTKPMIMYNSAHSISAKSFLGTNIAATTTADGNGDVKTALDTLFNHPNVGPFLCKQLIQRLVTSNPSGDYVKRCAQAFNNNGSGVRGDMAAVTKSIFLDTEARAISGDASYGKLREPILRLGNWMRSFEVTSTSGNWLMGSTSAQTSLNQSPLTSPSVFNFYRPGYVPPNSILGGKKKVAPEFQITDEVSVAAYVNTMQSAIQNGVGTSTDIKSAYTKELALAADPAGLVDRIDLLMGIRMSAGLKSKIVNAVSGVAIPAAGSKQADIDTANLNRVRLAILLSMASPEYLAQR
ncbi:DUF1800 domain-containing protein [Asticcacaulis sp. AC466]|uniref:DUF1800 domain-containing protein n=1 Tax=Asticcacaulis sp. AC466 TaxID=1282362 RepID=UPI001F29C4F3|nr:DUF1800 domain-containing protein [Asticcacaulis sp. AC466]